MPYFVDTNAQGLRLSYELQFPKTRLRLLALGDSFTFGPFLGNGDTYPGQLVRLRPDWEVVNAGVCGYTVTDELSLFEERAQFAEPDVVILQVLDNDLCDLLFFRRNEFDRHHRLHRPSPAEAAFLASLAGAK